MWLGGLLWCCGAVGCPGSQQHHRAMACHFRWGGAMVSGVVDGDVAVVVAGLLCGMGAF